MKSGGAEVTIVGASELAISPGAISVRVPSVVVTLAARPAGEALAATVSVKITLVLATSPGAISRGATP